jgi:Response regulator containing CheY-like receiver, AAA-type ATPase, and DNA-binding domains
MILICDDDEAVRSTLSILLKRAGYEVQTVSYPKEAVDVVRNTEPELIIMDMNYSSSTTGEEGLILLKQVKIFVPDVPVILITAWGSIALAVRGIQAGAFDFVTKPWNNITLLQAIETAIQLTKVSASDDASFTESVDLKNISSKIIGRSPLLMNVLSTVARIAKTNAPVLITGESGTGKELIAEAIHNNSLRTKSSFVKVNLGGISHTLFESEMFGHKKGAFTDAHYDRVGRFELADKGTIFLDEIGELDASSQVKLLRVLQDQTFEVLGDSTQKQTDVRVISATNRSLPEMVTKGLFREDLFYRINLITIRIPALRERIDDIPLLVKHFAKLQSQINGLPPVEISLDGMNYLMRLPYPGNIRELKNLVDRTILVSGKNVITDKDLKQQYFDVPENNILTSDSVLPLDDVEKSMIVRAMKLYGNNHSKMAIALGLSRPALYRRLDKYGLSKE